MTNIVALVVLGCAAIFQLQVASAQSEFVTPQPAAESVVMTANVPSLPPVPKGKSTILGGEIRNVDPVGDQLTLRVFGQHQLKVLFDERTQVYLDGKQIPLHDLAPAGHASVQTVLDGTSVYALSIHMLSSMPAGEYQGRVVNYDPGTRELTMSGTLSRQPIKLLVPVNTPMVRKGQEQFANQQSGESDLVRGALVSVEFESDKQGRGVASQLAILATPGSSFVFSGSISSLDMHRGSLVLVDPQDDQSYQVSFDSAKLPASRKLREGDRLKVTASFDGNRYVASALAVD
jgi:hypothetical protein